MGFKVGQKVVCIDASPFKGNMCVGNPSQLKENEIYTIDYFTREGTGVVLKEFQSNEYNINRFRPLELDYSFVEEVIKNIQQQPETV